MPYLDLHPDQHLYYEQLDGDPDRPWLIFLHEGLGSVAQWRDFPIRLCDRTGCPALVYDRLGYGKSSPLTQPRSIHYLHQYALCELPRVLAALLPDQDYLLVGHSDGGSIALIHGAARLPRLRGIATEAAHVLVEEQTLAGIRRADASFAQGRLVGLTRFHGDRTEAVFRSWADTWLDPAFAAWNIEYLLPSVQVPLLVVQGRDDQYGSEAQVETIVAKAGGPATPLLLEDCGHAPHQDLPPLALDLMSCFVNRVAR